MELTDNMNIISLGCENMGNVKELIIDGEEVEFVNCDIKYEPGAEYVDSNGTMQRVGRTSIVEFVNRRKLQGLYEGIKSNREFYLQVETDYGESRFITAYCIAIEWDKETDEYTYEFKEIG